MSETTIIIVWTILIVLLLVSIWSTIEGIKNRSRFNIMERMKYYFFSCLLSGILVTILKFSSEKLDLGLLITIMVTITLLFGNVMYYTRKERIQNILEIKFRLLKYLLFSFMFLFLSALISELF